MYVLKIVFDGIFIKLDIRGVLSKNTWVLILFRYVKICNNPALRECDSFSFFEIHAPVNTQGEMLAQHSLIYANNQHRREILKFSHVDFSLWLRVLLWVRLLRRADMWQFENLSPVFKFSA